METRAAAVYFCNVHMLMLSQDDNKLASAMDRADVTIPDGVPVAWLQRRLGHPDADVLRGYEAVELICSHASSRGNSVGFYGSTPEVLATLRRRLESKYPALQIEFFRAPGNLDADQPVDAELVDEINRIGLFCLFVGLGCPKQEKWIARYSPMLNCSLLGVGAAFDWLAGTTTKPPGWMENSGLGWLFRLLQNPRRMWHRYLKFNSVFVARVFRLWVQGALSTSGHRRYGK